MMISQYYVLLIVVFGTQALVLLSLMDVIYLLIYVLCYYLKCNDYLNNLFLLMKALFCLCFNRNSRSMSNRALHNLCLNEASCFYLNSLVSHKRKNHFFLTSKIFCNSLMRIYVLKSVSF